VAVEVVVQLDDGSAVRLSVGETDELYERLWRLVPERGAVTAAAKLRYARATARVGGRCLLDEREGALFRRVRTGHVEPLGAG
jgi:hypothetical protein